MMKELTTAATGDLADIEKHFLSDQKGMNCCIISNVSVCFLQTKIVAIQQLPTFCGIKRQGCRLPLYMLQVLASGLWSGQLRQQSVKGQAVKRCRSQSRWWAVWGSRPRHEVMPGFCTWQWYPGTRCVGYPCVPSHLMWGLSIQHLMMKASTGLPEWQAS
jgi:hypothetical protein